MPAQAPCRHFAACRNPHLSVIEFPVAGLLGAPRSGEGGEGRRVQHSALDAEAEHLGEEGADAVCHDGGAPVDDLVQEEDAVSAGDGLGWAVAPGLEDVSLDGLLGLQRTLALALHVAADEFDGKFADGGAGGRRIDRTRRRPSVRLSRYGPRILAAVDSLGELGVCLVGFPKRRRRIVADHESIDAATLLIAEEEGLRTACCDAQHEPLARGI
jgi:hypothetical protein